MLTQAQGHRVDEKKPPDRDAGASRAPVLLPFPEGPSIVPALVAGVISFVLLIMLRSFANALFLMLQPMSDEGGMGPLALTIPVFSPSVLIDCLLGAIVLSVVSLGVLMVHERRTFPTWLPYVLAWPIAWLLILPSKLEHGGSWLAWLVLGALAAGLFCIHWRSLIWAQTIWD
jgi:hypothetical protein